MNIDLSFPKPFAQRHIGVGDQEQTQMLSALGVDSLDQLIDETVPASIRLKEPLYLPEAETETDFLRSFKMLSEQNQVLKSFIGMGYYGCITPTVIQRNILENPGWYTAYTPYQAEIAQGRLEALANFQTMVMDLTGMEIANASLLDEGTAAAEAMTMLAGATKGKKKNAHKFFVDEKIFPQTLDVLKTRALPVGVELVIGSINTVDLSDPKLFGMLVQYPNGDGAVLDYSDIVKQAHEQQIFVAFAADILSLTLLTPPGEMGADVVVGSTQRLGVPMGFGGPHAAYFATKESFKRAIPGRIIGVSLDTQGKKAYRMALQTREQHIRREKATSNICTAQVLLAVIAGAYGVYHGPEGLKKIALRTHGLAKLFDTLLRKSGYSQVNKFYFDTLKIQVESGQKEKLLAGAVSKGINLRSFEDDHVGVSFDETSTLEDVQALAAIFEIPNGETGTLKDQISLDLPQSLLRTSSYLDHPVFHQYHSEHEMLRYLKYLENKDLSLVHSMISLGSCTMKLNATTEMIPLSWPEFGQMHPFAPTDQAKGYHELFENLERWLNEITGFAATSLQPNSGAQGEYAGLLAIRGYHEARGDEHRNVALIPSSAHGTNPASAVMAGMKVVIVQCDELGNIDILDLKSKAEQHKNNLAALMVTYPSTHGVFEEAIIEICDTIHHYGGQVYMDGANMNAQVGLTSPARIGADVCHLNLHKTFCIPHGGGGPGMGPICVAEHLKPHLSTKGLSNRNTAVSAAPFGSASILTISYAYIAMMGGDGLTDATKYAILNANYLKSRLEQHFPILYTGSNGRSAHEFIIDCREFKKVGVEVEDIAKRLMDYGYHAPTVSFPVAGTMMVEPTESESLAELDRFCDALIEIRKEIEEIVDGIADANDNVLKNAPHTAEVVMASSWDHSYTREKAAYPLPFTKSHKFWPSVSRIDSAFGDRNLVCSCIPIEEYAETEEVIG